MKLEKLSKEQEDLIPAIRQQWLDKLFKCNTRIDRDKATESIKWLYKFSNLEEPIVIFVDSPLGCQYAVHFLKNIFNNTAQVWAQVRDQVWAQVGDQVRDQVGAQVGAQVWAQVGDQVWAQVGDQVGDQVWAQVGAQVWAQVGAQVRDQVRAQVRAQVRDQVGAQVRDQVGAQVGDQVWAQVGAQVGDQVWAQVGDQVWAQVGDQVWDQKLEFAYFANYGNISDYGWISFYHYFKSIGIKIENEGFEKFSELIQSGIHDMIQLKGLCIVSELPAIIIRNENNRLHNLNGPAIKFNDGYEQFYINGRSIPKKEFDSIKNKKYTIDDFFNEKNEEIKSVCLQMMIELYGESYPADFFSSILKEIDTYVDKKEEQYLKGTTGGMNVGVYTLFKGAFDSYNIAYVRCYCPSTDRMFYLGVEPNHTNAKDAIASLYTIPKKLKPHIKSINRQGERFSTLFTEEGLGILNNSLSKEDLNNLVSISGNEYFSKIKYEF